jgi:hypothetical protein
MTRASARAAALAGARRPWRECCGLGGSAAEPGLAGYMAEKTNAMVNSPMAASRTLWHQRAVRLSMNDLQKFMRVQVESTANPMRAL